MPPSKFKQTSSTGNGPGVPNPPPRPVSVALAGATRCFPVTVNVAVAAPSNVGANRTVTVQLLPGPRVRPEHRSVVSAYAGDPDRETVSPLEARPPVLVRVSVRSSCAPSGTGPNSWDAGWKPRTAGPATADAAPADPPTRTRAAPATTATRRITLCTAITSRDSSQ